MFRAHPNRALLVPGLLVALAACGGDGGTPPPPPPPPPPVLTPSAETLPPTNVTTSSMRLNGRVNANNGTATWRFEYGTTNALGSSCNGTGTVTGAAATDVFCDISGLPADVTVFYRLVAQNSAGTGQSNLATAPLLSSSGINVTAVSPSPMVEGAAASLTGTGFNITPGLTSVTVDGRAAAITAITATEITFTVPVGDCRPAHDAQVVVHVGASASPARAAAVRPAEFVSMAVGQQRVFKVDPCLQFAAGTGTEAYLVGVQNVSPSGNSALEATLSGEAASGGAPAAPAASMTRAPSGRRASLAPMDLRATSRALRRAAHDQVEARLRQREREAFSSLVGKVRRPGASGVRRAVVPGNVAVGTTININVPNVAGGGSLCQGAVAIQAVVRKVGARGIWLEDAANPANGFTAADYEQLSATFDEKIYATNVHYFGEPTDLDGNGRALILVTKEVNRVANLLGFVFSGDLFGPSDCAGTNQAEVYYARAPDPTGTFGNAYATEKAREDAPSLIAHEFAHIIQFGVRIFSPTTTMLQTVWEAEGQATLAEEVVGHAITGRQPGQNYGLDVVFPGGKLSPWYGSGISDLAVYFGFQSATVRATGAPEQCTWLDRPSAANPQPCLGSRSPYGVSWSFLRYLSDQLGPTFPGGEAGFHRALVDNPSRGFGTIESVTGIPIDVLLARWAAALYVDDVLLTPQLSFTSWNLASIFDGLVETAQLQPRQVGFAAFNHPVTVRGGSSAYFLVSGSNHPAAAIRARGQGGPFPGGTAQVWVVRIQ